MSDKPLNKSRRDAVKTMLGGLAAVPVMNLVATAAAYAQELPDAEGTPLATTLGYIADPQPGQRAESMQSAGQTLKAGTPEEEQKCSNCQFMQEYAEEGWLGCTLIVGHKVTEGGWCRSWTLKQG